MASLQGRNFFVAFLLALVLVLEYNWLSLRTTIVLSSFIILFYVIESFRSQTAGLLDKIVSWTDKEIVVFGIPIKINTSKPKADFLCLRTFTDKEKICCTSGPSHGPVETVLESGNVVCWKDPDSREHLLTKLFESVSPSQKSRKKFDRHVANTVSKYGIRTLRRKETTCEVTKDNLQDIMVSLGEILSPYCRGEQLQDVLNHVLQSLRDGLVMDHVYEHRLEFLSAANSTDLLWMVYFIKVTRVKNNVFRTVFSLPRLKRAEAKMSFFVLHSDFRNLEKMLRTCAKTKEFRELLVIEESGSRAKDDEFD